MTKRYGFLITAVLGTLFFAMWSPARAQFINAHPSPPPPPFTPLYEPPPGVHFYALGTKAFREHDYAAAIDRFKAAASWASKPAEYSMGVMYFRGVGVTADRPLGTAWMKLASERGNPEYVEVRDAMIGQLTDAQLAHADELFNRLQLKYGDKVALRRARTR